MSSSAGVTVDGVLDLGFGLFGLFGCTSDVEHVVEGLDAIFLGDCDSEFGKECLQVDVRFHEGGAEVILADAENVNVLRISDWILEMVVTWCMRVISSL